MAIRAGAKAIIKASLLSEGRFAGAAASIRASNLHTLLNASEPFTMAYTWSSRPTVNTNSSWSLETRAQQAAWAAVAGCKTRWTKNMAAAGQRRLGPGLRRRARLSRGRLGLRERVCSEAVWEVAALADFDLPTACRAKDMQ